MMYQITDNRIDAKPDYSLDPLQLEFGKRFAPNMFSCEYKNGAWSTGQLKPVDKLSLHPAAIVFHYGQAIFEGMKAYLGPEGTPLLFRPEENARRMIKSAHRLDLPEIPEELFLQAVSLVVESNLAYIPLSPGSLYLRPTMFGTEGCLGVRGSSEVLFYILALPTGSYFKGNAQGPGSVSVMVSEDVARASRGGLGAAKAAANYAVSLKTIREGKERGCSQVLFLDAQGTGQIEEMGGMNIFFVEGTKLMTPALTDTILEGITRKSIVELAPTLGYQVEQRKISMAEVTEGIRHGRISEAFACGTAAVITGINAFRFSEADSVVELSSAPGPVTSELYQTLTAIQYGRAEDRFNWVRPVK